MEFLAEGQQFAQAVRCYKDALRLQPDFDAGRLESLPYTLTLLPGTRYILALYMNRNPHVAVVGATGAVGIEMIKTLEKRNFPVGKLTLLASARSVGKKLNYRGTETTVSE